MSLSERVTDITVTSITMAGSTGRGRGGLGRLTAACLIPKVIEARLLCRRLAIEAVIDAGGVWCLLTAAAGILPIAADLALPAGGA